jgi:aryl-alcohol dehydrogenase-like predicted oxidoreductase
MNGAQMKTRKRGSLEVSALGLGRMGMSYLEENAAAVEIELTPDDLAQIEAELPAVAGARYDEAGMAGINI